MISDFEALLDDELVSDICLIGAGAAGLTLAHHLPATARIIVIEAGGRRPRPTDDWLRGEQQGPYFDGFENGRASAYGGATRLWFGQCLRFDPIDFEARDWVPHSGWPIDAPAIEPFYDRAEAFLHLEGAEYDASVVTARSGLPGPAFDPSEIAFRCPVYCPKPDMAESIGKQVARRANVSVVLNAVATGLHLAPDGRTVAHVRLQGQSGRRKTVRSRLFVLCGGGIENPRLLLASNDVAPRGVGNTNDLVGRFFQDHPSGTTAVVAARQPLQIQKHFRKLRQRGLLYWPKMVLAERLQRERRLLNANALMLYDYASDSAMGSAKAAVDALRRRDAASVVRRGAALVRHLPELAAQGVQTRLTGKAPVFAASGIMLKAHVEQAPDPANRVTLANEPDRFGVPRARLTWRIHPDQVRTLKGITDTVDREMRRLGLGRLEPAAWLDAGPDAAGAHLADTYHHAGTTRMGATASSGVVDSDCRVFDTENVYVAGGSVFPTSSYANPTLTIIALAIRLSDHLAKQCAAA